MQGSPRLTLFGPRRSRDSDSSEAWAIELGDQIVASPASTGECRLRHLPATFVINSPIKACSSSGSVACIPNAAACRRQCAWEWPQAAQFTC